MNTWDREEFKNQIARLKTEVTELRTDNERLEQNYCAACSEKNIAEGVAEELRDTVIQLQEDATRRDVNAALDKEICDLLRAKLALYEEGPVTVWGRLKGHPHDWCPTKCRSIKAANFMIKEHRTFYAENRITRDVPEQEEEDEG